MKTHAGGASGPLDGVARPDIGLCPGDTAAAAHREAPLRLAASHIYKDTPGGSDTHPHSLSAWPQRGSSNVFNGRNCRPTV